ncbi:MAG: DegV family protein [Chloroflexota bacterium]
MPERTIAIVTDSTADLPADLRRRFGIEVVPVELRFGEESFADGVTIDADAFLARMQSGGPPPRTVAPPADRFAEAFRRLAERHQGIIAIVGSGKLGSTLASAMTARVEVAGIVPVAVVDSRSASMGLGWQAVRAAELVAGGAPLEAIADTLRAETSRYEVIFFVDTLDHLRRGGRVGRAAALIGQALDLKPLLRIDEGQVVPLDRARTHARAVDALVDAVAAMGAIERVAALHASGEAEGRALAGRLVAELGLDPGQVLVARIGPAVATHIGPGGLGVAVADLPG